jgi:hypothetical protein
VPRDEARSTIEKRPARWRVCSRLAAHPGDGRKDSDTQPTWHRDQLPALHCHTPA